MCKVCAITLPDVSNEVPGLGPPIVPAHHSVSVASVLARARYCVLCSITTLMDIGSYSWTPGECSLSQTRLRER